MIIDMKKALAIYCNQCGRLEQKEISLLDVKVNSPLVIHCQCGGNLLTIELTSKKKYKLISDCNLCEKKHYFHFGLKEMVHEPLVRLVCMDSEMDLGALGAEGRVVEVVEELSQSLVMVAQDFSQSNFFYNLDIMHNVLEHLYHLANKGKLSCGCGNKQLDVDFLSDRVELLCTRCYAKGIIWAECQEDWQLLAKYKSIRLKEGSYSLLEQLGI